MHNTFLQVWLELSSYSSQDKCRKLLRLSLPIKRVTGAAFPMSCLLIRKYIILVTVVAMTLPACDLTQNHLKMDRAGNKTVQDYRDAMAPRPMASEKNEKNSRKQSSTNIPDFERYIVHNADNLKPMPIVSVSVNQSVPIRDILYDLADQSGYGIQLDPRISGSIIYTARKKPLDVVVEDIAEMAGLRYEIRDGSIKFRLDTPYTKTYSIDYLNIIRQNEGAISTDISLAGAEGAGGGGEGGTETGSSFEVSSEGTSDFWKELDQNLQTLLRAHAPSDIMRARTQFATEGQRGVPSISQNELNQGNQQAGSGPARLKVDTLTQRAGDNQGGEEDENAGITPKYTINKQAGIVTVYADSKLHKKLNQFFTQLRNSVTAQVLIQAKVMQVELSDEFSAGIDWEVVNALAGEGTLEFASQNSGQIRNPFLSEPVNENFIAGIEGDDFSAVAEALSRFGTVNTLASPRVTAINNQSAVLNVARNDVYFELDVDREEQSEEAGGGTVITVDSQARSVPEGVLINVMPSIDLDKREISLRVRPTVTEIVGRVEDPAVPLTLAQVEGDVPDVTSEVPELDIQEIDSVVNLKSGEAIVIGGLMQNKSETERIGLPVLSEIPGFGALFRKQSDKIQKSELVIFMKARILNQPSESVHKTDKELYREFSQDRRPFDL